MLTKPHKRKLNPMLLNVLIISGLAHAIALLVLGGITVVKYIIPDDTDFEEPPAIEEVEPPKQVKIEIKQQPKPENQPLNNLKMKQVGNIAIANVDVDLPDMEESFTVSAGLGGSGSGLLGGTRGSLGIGMSDVSVFGLKTRAERILFVIDVNRQMVTDAKGGLNSFKIVKDEITDMVGNLSAGTLFNVMLMDRKRGMLFKQQLVPAGSEVHQELIRWLAPINNNANSVGLESIRGASNLSMNSLSDNYVHQEIVGHSHNQRGTETAQQTQVALEQGVDAIFFVTGYHKGFEKVNRRLTDKERADWDRTVASPKYQAQLAAHNAEKAEMQQRVNNKLRQINAERASKGQPPRVLEKRHGIYSQVNELKLKWKTKHPGWPPQYIIPDRDVEKYFKELLNELYTNKGAKEPSINVVLLLANDEDLKKEDETTLKKYIRFFTGKYRIIRGLAEIKSASSASTTTN
ncbi:MAG: hypothetical protein ACON4O_09245 [Lentimonas sp.]